jgi:hypothetical protein
VKIYTSLPFIIVSAILMRINCSNDLEQKSVEIPVTKPVEKVYDETGCLYKSYNGLVMAGYQGWFTAEGDEDERGWQICWN